MFESDRKGEVNLGRRLFLSGVGAALGGAALFSLRRPHVVAEAAKTEPAEVTIVQFSDAGKRLAKVKVARVAASVVTMRYSARRRSLILEPAGRVSGSRSRRKMCARFLTAVLVCSARRFPVPSVMHTLGTSSTTGRSRQGCATAWTALRCCFIRPRRRRPDRL